MKKIRILLVDDHPVIRYGLVTLLDDEDAFEVIGEAENGRQALELLKTNRADVVIMDIKMPEMNGIETMEAIHKEYPNVKVLALSMYDEQEYISRMLKAGAKGYILKNSSQDEVIKAVKTINDGNNYFSSKVSSVMLSQYLAEQTGEKEGGSTFIPLTNREKQIIRMIAEEMTNAEIAEQLNISKRTVDTHRRNLIKKLDVKNTAGLVKYAIKHGYMEIDKR